MLTNPPLARKQPQLRPILNRASPLLRNIKALMLPSVSRDLISGFDFSFNSSSTQRSQGTAGRSFRSPGQGTNQVFAGASAGDVFNGTECTVFCVRQHFDTTNRATAMFGFDNSTTSRVVASVPYSDGNCYWDCGSVDASHRLSVAWGGKTTNVEAVVLVAGAVKGREIWRNGNKLAGNAGITGSVSIPNASWTVLGSAGTHSDLADNEAVYLFGVVQRAWSDAEIRSWSGNPWQIFRARSVVTSPMLMAMPGTGGGGGGGVRPVIFICT